jgi:hypothetical protein
MLKYTGSALKSGFPTALVAEVIDADRYVYT